MAEEEPPPERLSWSQIRTGDVDANISRLIGCCTPTYSKLGMTGDPSTFATFVDAWPMRLDLPRTGEVKRLFAEMDTDHDRLLTLPEIAAGVRKLFPGFDMPAALMAAYTVADRNKDGCIQQAEFVRLCQVLQYTNNNVTTFIQVAPKGNLGVEFQSSTGRDATVKSISPGATALWADKLQVGDILLGTSGSFEDKMQAVKNARRPLRLTFVRLPDPEEMVPAVDSESIRAHLDGTEAVTAGTMAKLVRRVYPNFSNMKVLMQAFHSADQLPDGSMTPDQFIGMMHALRVLSNDAAALNEIDIALSVDGQLTLGAFVIASRRLEIGGLDDEALGKQFAQLAGASPGGEGGPQDPAPQTIALPVFHRWVVGKVLD